MEKTEAPVPVWDQIKTAALIIAWLFWVAVCVVVLLGLCLAALVFAVWLVKTIWNAV